MTNEPEAEAATESAVAERTEEVVRRNRVRSALSVLAGIIAIVGLIASVVAVWARGVLFDSEKVASAVDVALQEPAVTEALATYLTDQLLVAVDAEQFVLETLPPALDRLTPALVGGVRSFVQDRVEALLAKDQVRAVLVTVVERAHGRVMRLLEGDGGITGITITNGEVSVNMLPLLSLAVQTVQGLGLFENADVPVFTADGDPAEQIAELSSVLNRELPDQFGQLVVYRSEALSNAQESLVAAQQAMVLVKRSIVLVLALTLVAIAASVLLSVRRGRTVLVLVLAGAAAMVIVRAAVRSVLADAPTLVVDPGARVALATTVTHLASGLRTAVTVMIVLGLLAALGLFLTGSSSTAASLRRRAGSAGGSAGGLLTEHGDGVAIAAFGAALLLIFFAGLSIWSLVVAALLAVAGLWAMRASPSKATAER